MSAAPAIHVVSTRVRPQQSLDICLRWKPRSDDLSKSWTYQVFTLAGDDEGVATTPTWQDLSAFLAGELKRVREVVRVKVSERERNGQRIVHVWTALSADDRETRFKVYDVEQSLCNRFPEYLFEFHSHKAEPGTPEGETTIYES